MGCVNVSYATSVLQGTSAATASVLPLRPHTFRLDNALIDTWGEQIGATAVALYCALSRYANRQTGVCWPSITTLATKLKLGRNTVKKYLRVLVHHGLIEWQPRWDEAGDQASHLYTVHPCPAPQPVAPAAPAGGGSVADPPSVNGLTGGQSVTDSEQDLEQEKRTTVLILLSDLKKKTSTLAHLCQSYQGTPAEADTQAKQQRCDHPLAMRYQPYEGYQRCRKCHFDGFTERAEAGPPAGPAPQKGGTA